MGIFKRRYPVKKRECPHPPEAIRNIYGDEIIAAGWNRSQCIDCGKFFKNLDGR